MGAVDDLVAKIAGVLEAYPGVAEAYVFGSAASGATHAHSDVDVAVYLTGAVPGAFGAAAELSTDLAVALGRDDVDVTILNDAPPLLYHRVLRDGRRVLTRDLRATTTREAYATSRYLDFVPHLAKLAAARAGTRMP